MSAHGRFLVFYAALFAAFGVASPFLPALLLQHGLSAAELGSVLAAGTAVRLLAGPLGGRFADRTGRAPLVLAGLIAAASLIGLLYLPARGVMPLALVSLAHAAVLAPLVPVADALALAAAQAPAGFRYGSVRGVGSAAFIGGALLSGVTVDRLGLDVIVGLNACLLAGAGAAAWLLPPPVPGGAVAPSRAEGGAAVLLRNRVFVRMMVVAGLIGGSHAMHDTFEVIRWRAAGLSAQQSGVLWALSVAGEVVVFMLLGPKLLQALGPARAMMLAALAGIVRWSAVAVTAWFPVMALVEPLHGLTFALLHLACMEVIGRVVPGHLAATAQAFYGTVAMGAAAAAITLGSGALYTSFGAGSFWFMVVLCALALPAAWRLRSQAFA